MTNADRFRNQAGLTKLSANWPAARLVEIWNSGEAKSAQTSAGAQKDGNKSSTTIPTVALAVSLAGFGLSAANLYLTQFRDPPIRLYVGREMAIYYPRDGGFGMYIPIAFVNRAQRGGAFLRVRAVMRHDAEQKAFGFE